MLTSSTALQLMRNVNKLLINDLDAYELCILEASQIAIFYVYYLLVLGGFLPYLSYRCVDYYQTSKRLELKVERSQTTCILTYLFLKTGV